MADMVLTFRPGTVADIPGFRALGEAVVPPTYGPIDAAFNAVDKLIPAEAHSLEDYSIQTISEGKDAQGEAMVKLSAGNRSYTGRGLSTDVVEASILAYINGMNKLL